MKARTKKIYHKQKSRPRPKKKRVDTGRRKGADTQRAVSLLKVVGLTMRLREQNNHLQGLYAELGKLVHEQLAQHAGKAVNLRTKGVATLVEQTAEIKKTMARLEREIRSLKKAA